MKSDEVEKTNIAKAWLEEMKDEEEEEKKATEELKREDVEMTDEDEEEQRRMIEELHKARKKYENKSHQREIELSVEH